MYFYPAQLYDIRPETGSAQWAMDNVECSRNIPIDLARTGLIHTAVPNPSETTARPSCQ